MTFTEAVGSVLSKYVQFEGRASRSEYWYFVLFYVLLFVFCSAIDSSLVVIAFFALLIPQTAVLARRLHDTDRSGWWQFIALVPIAGIIMLIVWLAREGTIGPNQFGLPASDVEPPVERSSRVSATNPPNMARAPQSQTASSSQPVDLVTQLAALSRMHQEGRLTDQEFEQAKARILRNS